MNRRSENNKIILFFFIFAVGCIITFIILDVLFYSYNLKTKLMNNSLSIVKQKEFQFSSSVNNTKDILLSIKNSKNFTTYQNQPKKNKYLLDDVFLMLVNHDKNIMQLRYIDSTGFEKIRVDRSSIQETPKIISQENLQNKSSRYYFTNSTNKESKVWYSKLDLNIENGKVEIPYKATLRAILPIQKDGSFNGVLIINYFMDDVLNSMIDISTHNGYIVNELGNSLVHHKKENSWSYYRKSSFRWKNEFDLQLNSLSKNFIYKDSDILIKKLSINLPESLFIVLKTNSKNLGQVYKDRFFHYVLLSIVILFLSLIMSVFFSKYLKKVFLILKDSNTLNQLLKIKVKKKTKELVESQKKLTDIISNINDFIWEVNIEGKYTYLSPQVEIILGYKIDELLGKTPFELMPKKSAEKTKDIFFQLLKECKPIIQLLNENTHKNGHSVYLETSGNPIIDEDNNIVGYRGSNRDVTQKINSQKLIDENYKQIKILNKQLQVEVFDEIEKNRKKDMQLFAQSKMASMGEMIGNIAHQWRQPLSAISTLASGMKVMYDHNLIKSEDIPKVMDDIVMYTEQLSQTIGTFMNFLKEKKEFRHVGIINTIQKSIDMVISSLVSSNIQIIHNLNSMEEQTINTIQSELQEVLINVINNAKDALIENSIKEPIINLTLIQNEKEIIIEIEDNAGGISEAIIDKVFDPYFTTKETSNGIGLHMSYRVITESLDGTILAKNGKSGAIFSIKLPL